MLPFLRGLWRALLTLTTLALGGLLVNQPETASVIIGKRETSDRF